MLFINAKPKSRTAVINGQKITVGGNETLLHAALREGLPFPNSCRVGGCGSCKCKLVGGDVKELTETGYLLTDAEMDQSFILACQSTLQSDVVLAHSTEVGHLFHGIVGSHSTRRWAADLTDGFMESGLC